MMPLQSLDFASLGGDGVTMEPAAKLMLEARFGSVERWREEFIAMGKALGGGSGWVLLVFRPRKGTLVSQWAADHTQARAAACPSWRSTWTTMCSAWASARHRALCCCTAPIGTS
jgi:Fe-Mn family superoxide dismutase